MGLQFSTTGIQANSYISVVEANEYFKAHEYTEWDELEHDSAKEHFLIESSLSLDGLGSFVGEKKEPEQTLQFPRKGTVDIPLQVKFSVCVLIRYVFKNNSLRNIRSEKVGNIFVEYFAATSRKDERYPPEIQNLMYQLVSKVTKMPYPF